MYVQLAKVKLHQQAINFAGPPTSVHITCEDVSN